MAGTSPDRIVLDTNNILSLFFAEEYAFFVYLKLQHPIELFTCRQQFDELASALRYPKVKKLLKTEPRKLIRFLEKYSTTITVNQRFDRVPDLKDKYLVDLAYTAKVDYIISGDREFLSLKHVGKVQIISISRLRQILHKSSIV